MKRIHFLQGMFYIIHTYQNVPKQKFKKVKISWQHYFVEIFEGLSWWDSETREHDMGGKSMYFNVHTTRKNKTADKISRAKVLWVVLVLQSTTVEHTREIPNQEITIQDDGLYGWKMKCSRYRTHRQWMKWFGIPTCKEKHSNLSTIISSYC